MFTFAIDKQRLLDHFKKDPVLFAYHIGDLDEFFFPHCQFPSIYSSTARIEDTVLIYTGGKVPVVVAFGLTERFEGLVREVREFFPVPFNAHFQTSVRPVLAEVFREKPLGTLLRMKIGTFKPATITSDIIRLGHGHEKELEKFYKAAYPDTYFTARMLETGKYYGIRDGKSLVAVTGVHVYSREYKVAALGNIATHPKYRGKGLATKVTGHLCQELVDEGLMVCLNVKKDNLPAIACYEKLGFEKAFEYEEARFELK
ncbi:MAG: GNAT family N-acetyltransferase [Candidatus Zixiibacteriota bacterium]